MPQTCATLYWMSAVSRVIIQRTHFSTSTFTGEGNARSLTPKGPCPGIPRALNVIQRCTKNYITVTIFIDVDNGYLFRQIIPSFKATQSVTKLRLSLGAVSDREIGSIRERVPTLRTCLGNCRDLEVEFDMIHNGYTGITVTDIQGQVYESRVFLGSQHQGREWKNEDLQIF